MFDDTDRQEIRRRRAKWPARTRAAMSHADARWGCRRCHRRSGRRYGGLLRSRELVRHRRRIGRASDLEVITAPTQVDDASVVRVFENSYEHPIAETF